MHIQSATMFKSTEQFQNGKTYITIHVAIKCNKIKHPKSSIYHSSV